MLESIKFKLARVLGVCESPALLYLLSMQATDSTWSSIWFLIAMTKFVQNVWVDYIITYQRQKHIEMIKNMHEGFDEYQKKNKESKK
jgi:hypothetical protein